MSSNTRNFVLELFTALDCLSSVQNGMSISDMQKAMPYCTRGEVIRVLKTLESMTYAYQEKRPHGRTGKLVYHMTETAAIHCAAIARQYTERN